MLWFWGLAGAFIYAAPRWVVGLAASATTGASKTIMSMELAVALTVGALAAGMFGPLLSAVALTTLHVKDDNAICGLIGLFANRVAPDMVEKGSVAFNGGAAIVGRVLKALKGTEK